MADKKVVVDEKSATIREVWEGQVMRFWPYRVTSDGSVSVGPSRCFTSDNGSGAIIGDRIRVFAPPVDSSRWREEDHGRRRSDDDGWRMKPSDRPTFAGPLLYKSFCWRPLGPKQAIAQELEKLRVQLKELEQKFKRARGKARADIEAQGGDVVALIEEKESQERSRRIQARQEWERTKGRPSVRHKKQTKVENEPEGEGDKQQKKGKKGGSKKGKGKKKSKGGDGGEGGGKKGKGDKGKGQGRRGGK